MQLALLNPGDVDAAATIAYLQSGVVPVTRAVTVPTSRAVIGVTDGPSR